MPFFFSFCVCHLIFNLMLSARTSLSPFKLELFMYYAKKLVAVKPKLIFKIMYVIIS